MMGYGVMTSWAWLWMLLPTLPLFTAITFGILAAIRPTGVARPSQESSALSILERRYASGEISLEEFNEARQTLGLA